jgi:hypothetical protein
MTSSNLDEVVRENAAREGQVIMPFYLIADVSSSMAGDAVELNTAIADLIDAIVKDPVVDDLVMLSVITFNHDAATVVPLSSPSDITLPVLQPGGGTRYEAAFREFDRAFSQDRVMLRQQGIKVYRPCVFFLTDGAPGDRGSFESAFRSLFAYDPQTGAGNRSFPYFVPFGFRDAPVDVIQKLAYPDFGSTKGRWFMIRSDHVGEVLQTIATVLGNTVVSSGQSAAVGQPTIVVPEPPAGSTVQFGDAGDFVE